MQEPGSAGSPESGPATGSKSIKSTHCNHPCFPPLPVEAAAGAGFSGAGFSGAASAEGCCPATNRQYRRPAGRWRIIRRCGPCGRSEGASEGVRLGTSTCASGLGLSKERSSLPKTMDNTSLSTFLPSSTGSSNRLTRTVQISLRCLPRDGSAGAGIQSGTTMQARRCIHPRHS